MSIDEHDEPLSVKRLRTASLPWLSVVDGEPITTKAQNDSSEGQDADGQTAESRLEKIINLLLTPLNILTFILSLTLIDYLSRRRENAQHHQQTPHPYQHPDDTTWRSSAEGHSRGKEALRGDVPGGPRSTLEGKRKREVVRREVGDALGMRGTVGGVLGIVIVMVGLGLGWGMNILFSAR